MTKRKQRTHGEVCAILYRWFSRRADQQERRELELTHPDNVDLLVDSWDGTVHGIYE